MNKQQLKNTNPFQYLKKRSEYVDVHNLQRNLSDMERHLSAILEDMMPPSKQIENSIYEDTEALKRLIHNSTCHASGEGIAIYAACDELSYMPIASTKDKLKYIQSLQEVIRVKQASAPLIYKKGMPGITISETIAIVAIAAFVLILLPGF